MATLHASEHCEYNSAMSYRQLRQDCQELKTQITEKKSEQELLVKVDEIDQKAKELFKHSECFKRQDNSIKARLEKVPMQVQDKAFAVATEKAMSASADWLFWPAISAVTGSVAYWGPVAVGIVCAHPVAFSIVAGVVVFQGVASVTGSLESYYEAKSLRKEEGGGE